MAINGVSFGNTILNQSVLDIKNQLTALQSQLTSGKKSTTYAGLGVNEGFAIAARSQLEEISAFTDTATNVNTNIGIANTGLQSLVDIGNSVQNSANSSSQVLNSAGQTIAQQNATSQLSTALGILNTQAGNRFLFSGSAVNTPTVASFDDIITGTVSQAGLKQVISERQQADVGTGGLGRLVISPSPPPLPATPTSVQVSEDVAGSPFGLKLNAISSTLTGSTVTGPTGSPPAVSVDLGATNPNNGDQVSFKFNLPDGTTEQIQLTASSATPPPAGSFAIGLTSTATAGNLNAALNSAIKTLANTSLVAASAIQAGSDFFSPAGTATGTVVKSNATALVTGNTSLSGAAGSDSIATNFGVGPPPDTITVNGTTLTFVASGAIGNQLNVTDSVQTLLSKIDSITGTATPSTISNGAITLQAGAAALTVTSSNSVAFAALGFPATANAPANGTVTGSVVDNKVPLPVVGATLLSGVPGTNSLTTSFAAGNSITVNGTKINFVSLGSPAAGTSAPGVSPITIDITDSVQTLLSKIDSITGTSTPSTISGGVITLHTDNAASLTITSSNTAAFAALGLPASGTVTATQPPLRVNGSPFGTATSLVNGTANTVAWYTGESSSGSARATATARVDQSVTVQYGIRANERGIRAQIQTLAVFSAVTTSVTNPNGGAQVSALSARVAKNLSPQLGQQTIQEIQTDLATAQSKIKDTKTRQEQSQGLLQGIVDQAESVSPDQVASQILALQTNLQASFQTTALIAQLNLTKFLPLA
jgi:flagellar hook-associated protein 3 FlgL